MKQKNVRVYVTTHKEYPILENDVYKGLFVGAKNKDSFNYLRDDTGENISDKNEYYSEFTGLYWIWKNSTEDIVGVNHYRRLFVDGFLGSGNLLTKDEIIKYLNENDVIVYKKRKLGRTLYKDCLLNISEEDLEISLGLFKDMYPDYKNALDEVFNGNVMYSFSLFISSKKWFDEYCEFLFPFLSKLENELKSNNNLKNKRVIGYLGEILFHVYIVRNKCKTKEVFVKFLEAKSSLLTNLINNSQILSFFAYYYFYIKKEL